MRSARNHVKRIFCEKAYFLINFLNAMLITRGIKLKKSKIKIGYTAKRHYFEKKDVIARSADHSARRSNLIIFSKLRDCFAPFYSARNDNEFSFCS